MRGRTRAGTAAAYRARPRSTRSRENKRGERACRRGHEDRWRRGREQLVQRRQRARVIQVEVRHEHGVQRRERGEGWQAPCGVGVGRVRAHVEQHVAVPQR
jgi:hypothetical protein